MTAATLGGLKGVRPISVVTAYDAGQAAFADQAGIDAILVGDSLGMTTLGHADTLAVTMEHMLHHVEAAARGTTRALLIADMPFASYDGDPGLAVERAAALVRAGARAVKLEGGTGALTAIKAMLRAGIPVMGHVGLCPQHAARLGGFFSQGRQAAAALDILEQTLALQEAGCFAMLIEAVPSVVGQAISARLRIPTIGIGAGPGCDGQVLVWHDLLGLSARTPRFVKRYAELGQAVAKALGEYHEDVVAGRFPGQGHGYTMSEEEERLLKDALKDPGGTKKDESA